MVVLVERGLSVRGEVFVGEEFPHAEAHAGVEDVVVVEDREEVMRAGTVLPFEGLGDVTRKFS